MRLEALAGIIENVIFFFDSEKAVDNGIHRDLGELVQRSQNKQIMQVL